MTKFELGKQVICTKDVQFFTKGNKYKIQNIGVNHITLLDDDAENNDWFIKDAEETFEIIPTKNQRITALEKEVAELLPLKEEVEELKLIVHQLRKPSTVVEEVSTSSVEDNPFPPTMTVGGVTTEVTHEEIAELISEPSPNQLRAEIIEKAKGFVEESKNSRGHYEVPDEKVNFHSPFICNVEFIVNQEKRTIVALLKGFETEKIYIRGIAKCHPNNVFNESIGRAIALGRALGLDVSEFEQAVLPNEVVVGHVATHKDSERNYTITDIDGDTYYTEPGSHYHKESFTDGSAYIINDTNAIYGDAK